jgi:hypothetical protein
MLALNTVTKSLTAALIAGAGALQTANIDGVITLTEWVTIVTVAVVSLGLVWAVPNTASTASATAQPPLVKEPL